MATENKYLNMEKRAWKMISPDKSVICFDSVKKSIEMIKAVEFTSAFLHSKAIFPEGIVSMAKRELLRLFPGINTEIPFLSDFQIKHIYFLNSMNNYSNQELLDLINKYVEMINIFDIPFNYIHSYTRNAHCNMMFFLRDDDDYLSKMPLYATSIKATGPSDYIMVITFIHELTHLLTKRFRGIIRNPYHIETMPITLEKIISLERDSTEVLFKKNETSRNIDHKAAIQMIENNEDNDREDAHSHFISGLIANCIFYRYYNESDIGKKYILSEIQQVLNGEKNLDLFLQEFGIDLQNSEVVEATEFSLKRSLTKK